MSPVRVLVRTANQAIAFEGGRIIPPEGPFDITLSVPDGQILPGLINVHDHLHRNHYGRLGAPPYRNAYEWGEDIHHRFAGAIAEGRRLPRRDALLRGAWKNLLAGVTTVVHHDPWERDFEVDFPLRVVPVRGAHSVRGLEGTEPWGRSDGDVASRMWKAPVDVSRQRSRRDRTGDDAEISGKDGPQPFAIHVAEGVDEEAAQEVRVLKGWNLVNRDLLAVHLVGADDDGIARLRAAGAAIVWCPSSNHFLFGRSAPAALLADGVDVLVGSDSLLTASGDLLDELRYARALQAVSDERLRDSVGRTAAARLGLPEPSLEPGEAADLVVLRRKLLEASAEDVAVVVAGGVIRVLDPCLAPALGTWSGQGTMIELRGGVERWVDQRSTAPRMTRQARSR